MKIAATNNCLLYGRVQQRNTNNNHIDNTKQSNNCLSCNSIYSLAFIHILCSFCICCCLLLIRTELNTLPTLLLDSLNIYCCLPKSLCALFQLEEQYHLFLHTNTQTICTIFLCYYIRFHVSV